MRGMNQVKDSRAWIWLCAVVCFTGVMIAGADARAQGESQRSSAASDKALTARGPDPDAVENWTALSAKESGLKLIRPEFAEKDDVPNTGFIRERLQANWRAGDAFDLYVIRPRGVEKPPVILYLYSLSEDTEQFKKNNWCEAAVQGGYAAVGFVPALTGHRTRYRLGKEWFVSEMQEALGSTVHDVQFILDYLTTRGDLDMNRVAMFGTGAGGAIAVLASAADQRIRVVDLLAPWGDWPRWLPETKVVPDNERAEFVKPEFLAKVAPLDPVAWAGKMKAKSVRIQDIRGNKAMPDKSQEKLEHAAPDFALINQFGNGRAFMAAQPAFSLFDWMKEQLKAEANPQVAEQKNERIRFFPAVQVPDGLSNIGKASRGENPQPVTSGKPQ